MNAWTRVNLMLAALAGVLLALEFWPGDTPARTGLTGLAPDGIRAVRIERGNRLALSLQRGPDGWRMLYPEPARAQGRRVEQLLAVASAPVLARYPASDDPGRYGLDEPAAVLQLDETRLLFGDRDPAQKLRYVLAENEVRVIDDVYFNLLTLPARHFRGD